MVRDVASRLLSQLEINNLGLAKIKQLKSNENKGKLAIHELKRLQLQLLFRRLHQNAIKNV